MAFNANEPRDAHGQWVKGVGDARKALEAIFAGHGADSKSPVDKSIARLAGKALGRHLLHGRKLPHESTSYDKSLANIEHIAAKTREDAVKLNKTDPKVAQQLRKQARALEEIHRVHSGKVSPKKPVPSPDKPTVSKTQVKGPVGEFAKAEPEHHELKAYEFTRNGQVFRVVQVEKTHHVMAKDANYAVGVTKSKSWQVLRKGQGGKVLWEATTREAAVKQFDKQVLPYMKDQPAVSKTQQVPRLNKIDAGHYASEDGKWAVVSDAYDKYVKKDVQEEHGVAHKEWALVYSPKGGLKEDHNAGENLDWYGSKADALAALPGEWAKRQAAPDLQAPKDKNLKRVTKVTNGDGTFSIAHDGKVMIENGKVDYKYASHHVLDGSNGGVASQDHVVMYHRTAEAANKAKYKYGSKVAVTPIEDVAAHPVNGIDPLPPAPPPKPESLKAGNTPRFTVHAVGGVFEVHDHAAPASQEVVASFDDRGKARRNARRRNRAVGIGPAKKSGGGGGGKGLKVGDWVTNKDGRRGEIVGINTAKELKLPKPEELLNAEELLGKWHSPWDQGVAKEDYEKGFLAGARDEPLPVGANYNWRYGHNHGKKARKLELVEIRRDQKAQKAEAKGGFVVRYNTGKEDVLQGRHLKAAEPPVSIYRHKGDVPTQANELFDALKLGVEADETDWSRLDPAKRDIPKGHVIGHAQELLFDLARGNERPEQAKVVSDAEMRNQLKDEGFTEKARAAAEAKLAYKLKVPHELANAYADDPSIKKGKGVYSGGTMTVKAASLSPEDMKALEVVARFSQGFHVQDAKGNHIYRQEIKAHRLEGETLMDTIKRLGLDAGAYAGILKDQRRTQVDKAVDATVKKEVTKRREKENTTSIAYSLPHWNGVRMVSQNWHDVADHMSRASKGSFVPVFHAHGAVEDGIVYHRGERSGTKGTTLVEGHDIQVSLLGDFRLLGEDTPGRWAVQRLDKTTGKPMKGKAGYDLAPQYFTSEQLLLSDNKWRESPGKPWKDVTPDFPSADAVTSARSLYESDKQITDALEKAGAKLTENSKNIDPGYRGRGKIYAGQMWLIDLGDSKQISKEAALDDFLRRPDIQESQGYILASSPTEKLRSRVQADAAGKSLTHGQLRDIIAKREKDLDAELQASIADFNKGLPPGHNSPSAVQVGRQRVALQEYAAKLKGHADESYSRKTPGKRIEYVPHAQPKLGAPTSQRGRITVHGLSPEEATKKLQELGIVGDIETHVPYEAVMRSGRRDGLVLPLHRDYLTGDAPPPTLLHLIVHGVTSRDSDRIIESVIRGGGVHSIAERYRRGIQVNSASPAGDIRSGIDHVVFGAHDSGHTCGGGSPVRIAYKPEALLRRNIVMAPRDYGGMATRYDLYKKYLNGLQAKAGEPTTSLYQPVSPKVRQAHIAARKRPGSAEFNIAGSIPVEDMAVIGVQNQAMADRINKILDEEMLAGRITSRPDVVIGGEAFRVRVEA